MDDVLVREEIRSILAQFVDDQSVLENLAPTTRLREDLDIESIHYIDLLVAVENQFGITFDENEALRMASVGDWLAAIARKRERPADEGADLPCGDGIPA